MRSKTLLWKPLVCINLATMAAPVLAEQRRKRLKDNLCYSGFPARNLTRQINNGGNQIVCNKYTPSGKGTLYQKLWSLLFTTMACPTHICIQVENGSLLIKQSRRGTSELSQYQTNTRLPPGSFSHQPTPGRPVAFQTY